MIINTFYKTDTLIDGIKYIPPSEIINYGYSIELTWKNKNNQFHNENGPAYIRYNQNGNVKYKSWWINGELHNDNGLASIEYDQNGNVSYKAWWINGKRHNENGPAFILYRRDGSIIKKEYFKNGKQIIEQEE